MRTHFSATAISAWLAALAAVLVLTLSSACERKSGSAGTGAGGGRVVVYTSVDRVFAEPVLQAAGKALGLQVVGVYDTEETKSTGLVNRLIAKKDNPDGDLFWSGDPARAAQLKSKGVTTVYAPKGSARIAATFKDGEGHWTGFSARTRVLLVNANLVKPGEEPTSIFDLTDPKWKGKVAMPNPLFGTTSFHIAAIFEALGDEKARAWLDALKANGVQIVSSNGECKRQVAAGQAAVGIADSDDAAEAIADGQPVRVVMLDQKAAQGRAAPLGTLVIPNTISVIKGTRNIDGAMRVADYLLTDASLKMLAASCAQAPLVPGVPVPPGVASVDGLVPMSVDYAKAADHLDRLMPDLKSWVEKK